CILESIVEIIKRNLVLKIYKRLYQFTFRIGRQQLLSTKNFHPYRVCPVHKFHDIFLRIAEFFNLVNIDRSRNYSISFILKVKEVLLPLLVSLAIKGIEADNILFFNRFQEFAVIILKVQHTSNISVNNNIGTVQKSK